MLFAWIRCRLWIWCAVPSVDPVGVLYLKNASRLAEDGSDNVRQGAARHLLSVPLRHEGERNIARLWVYFRYFKLWRTSSFGDVNLLHLLLVYSPVFVYSHFVYRQCVFWLQMITSTYLIHPVSFFECGASDSLKRVVFMVCLFTTIWFEVLKMLV